MIKKALATSMLLLSVGLPLKAAADLLEYEFESATGEARRVNPDQTFVNPVGQMTFALGAGIDRKVKVTLVRSSGQSFASSESGLLGPSDRIEVDGKSYYGDRLSLPSPTDGSYTIRTQILSASGSVVAEKSHSLIVDTVAPVAGEITWDMGYGRGTAPDGKPKFSVVGTRHITVNDIDDDRSGIGEVKYRSYRVLPDGTKELYTEEPATTIDTSNGLAMIGDGGRDSGAQRAFSNHEQLPYELYFDVSDKAGNVTTRKLSFYNNSACGAPPELVSIEDPTYSGNGGFRPVSGESVAINKNPLKAIYRVPVEDHEGTSEGAIFGGGPEGLTDHGIQKVEGGFAYFMIEGPAGTDGTFNYTSSGWTNFSTYRCFPFSFPSPTFSDEAAPPVLTGEQIEAYIDGYGWVGSTFGNPQAGEIQDVPRDTRISKIRFTAEPRVYDQTIGLLGGSCDIPAGETTCVADVDQPFNATGTADNYHNRPRLRRKDLEALYSSGVHTWEWDASDPILEGMITHDKEGKEITFGVTERHADNTWNRVKLKESGLVVKQNGSVVDSFQSSRFDTNGEYTVVTASYDGLVNDGTYAVYMWARDNYGNYVERLATTVENDSTGPGIAFNIESNDNVGSLDDITISLSDALDESPTIESVNIQGGPAKEDVFLAVRSGQSGNEYLLEYPVMFPSMKAGEEYRLTVEAVDKQNNLTKKELVFTYEPRQVRLADGLDGVIQLPALTQEFIRSDGSRVIETERLTLSDGSTVLGTYDVYATLRSDADVPMVVNGVRIEPGETLGIMDQHNFASTDGKLSIPVYPAEAGTVGTSSLLVMTTAPNSPILVVDINTWEARASLSASSWEIRQVIDPVDIQASARTGVPCRLSSSVDDAKAGDPIRDPVCLLEWDRIPDEAAVVDRSAEQGQLARVQGQAVSIGEQPVSYNLYLFNGNGEKIKVGQGRRDLTVTSAFGSVSYDPGSEVESVSRVIEDFDFIPGQITGPECSPTLSAQTAINSAANRALGNASRVCLFEWTTIPDGLMQDEYRESPQLFGALDAKGEHPVEWRVSIFTKNGTRVTLAEQEFVINAVNPPLPDIAMNSRSHWKDNMYTVPMEAGYLGDSQISSLSASLDVKIKRNGTTIESDTFEPYMGRDNEVLRRLSTDDRDLWEETTYEVSAHYTRVPDVGRVQTYKAIAVPDEGIKPRVVLEENTAIDTELLPVKVQIYNQYRYDQPYSEETMGRWKVRLIQEKAYNEEEVITEYASASGGEAVFNVDISEAERASLRISAEAVLESPVEGYERIERSNRPAFVTVLRGGAIAGDVEARRLSGEAPFFAAITLDLDDREDYRAAGDIIWEISDDNGQSWKQHIPEERYKFQFLRTYEKGRYRVRAITKNRHSGLTATTEEVDIVAYDKPEIAISGPQTQFVGTEARYQAVVTDKETGAEVEEGIVIEWSTDGGETFDQTGKSISLTQEEPGRVAINARVRSLAAPEDDLSAYSQARGRLEFAEIRPPRVRVLGERLVEEGKPYVFEAHLDMPYRGMDAAMSGQFTLPDGRVVEGTSVEYTPTEADVEAAQVEVSYTAWFDGFRDQGAEATDSHRARVWQYVWPEFAIQLRTSADVAPAEVSAIVRARGFRGNLEEPTYEWSIPEAATVIENRRDITRAFTLAEPGDYTLRVKITDARGHESVVEEPLIIGEADPYSIELAYSGSNRYDREPLEVLIRPYISGGHPRDRISSQIYSVNGEAQEEGGTYGRATLNAGEHTVDLTIQSEMGKVATGEVQVKVKENQLPSCSLESRESFGAWVIYATCEDPDGRVRDFEWTIGGEQIAIGSSRIAISKASHDAMPSVQLIGVDESGGRSEPAYIQ